jgi:hypothetical protein
VSHQKLKTSAAMKYKRNANILESMKQEISKRHPGTAEQSLERSKISMVVYGNTNYNDSVDESGRSKSIKGMSQNMERKMLEVDQTFKKLFEQNKEEKQRKQAAYPYLENSSKAKKY